MALFGSSGIRGVVGEELTYELAMHVGMVLGETHHRVCVGTDVRTSASMLEGAITTGLMAMGADVTKVGMVSTPTLACYASNFDCGVMLTASHNPAQYNGIKLFNSDGCSFNSKEQMELEKKLKKVETRKLARWDKVGTVYENRGAEEYHIQKILDVEGLNNASMSDLTVVCDAGCGAGSLTLPYLLRRLGCRVISLNS
ncbi:MAG: phosphohexomutase domain-containing protein, partial [Methermicoccaceae archaeon]